MANGAAMKAYLFCFAAILGVAVALPSHSAEKPRPPQTNQASTKKVWTNDDIDDLRARGLISEFAPGFSLAQSKAGPVEAAFSASQSQYPAYNSRFEDPEWYAQKAADLQAELDRRRELLRQQQVAMELAQRGITQPGVALDQPSYGVTPQDAVQNLTAAVREAQAELDDLSDLARKNDIPQGIVRG